MATLDVLNRKIKQIHAALGGVTSNSTETLRPKISTTGNRWSIEYDFTKVYEDGELYNKLELLINNIACIKDHLREWCKQNSAEFKGEELINNEKYVAIVHDLWNISKHSGLNSDPRSGCHPKIGNVNSHLVLSTGNKPGSSAEMTMDPYTGRLVTYSSDGEGASNISIKADILDENDKRIGDLISTCTSAIEKWEKLLRASGVPIATI